MKNNETALDAEIAETQRTQRWHKILVSPRPLRLCVLCV
jgi:hypothetical protein